MNTKHGAPATTESKRASGLSRLVATEESLEARVRDARDEAARLLEDAREQASAAWERVQQELAPATEELLASIAAQARSESDALARTRVARVAAYEAVAGEWLDVLARRVLESVIGPPATPSARASP